MERMLGFKTTKCLAMVALALTTSGGACRAKIFAPGGGQIYALVVGLDKYESRIVPTLQGAENDARDLSDTLTRAGAAHVTHLRGPDATRATLAAGLQDLVSHSKKGDLVVISFAGHGITIPEKVKGSKRDGLDEAYLLYNFSDQIPDFITGPEMKSWLMQFEKAGVDVLYVVDTCFGGEMIRNWDERSGEYTMRAALAAAAAIRDREPIWIHPVIRFPDKSTFERVTFLAAVDKNTLAPEVDILMPDEATGQPKPTKRGALSYAVARAIDGMPAVRTPGAVSRNDLFAYAKQIVLQYSQNKQLIVPEPSAAPNVVVWRTVTPPEVSSP
jgi:hypothetical protein